MASFDTGLNTGFIEDEEEKKKQAHIKQVRDFDTRDVEEEQAGYKREIAAEQAKEESDKAFPQKLEAKFTEDRGGIEKDVLEDELVDTKNVRTKDRSITSVDKSGIRAIEAQQDKVLQSQKASLEQLSQLDSEQSQQAQQITDQHNVEVNTLNQKKIEAEEKYNNEVQKEMDYIDQQRERLANTQPKSFWANKDTDDKLAMGIAVLVSSIGAGMTSSRADSGTDLLSGIIARDLEQKEKHLNRQIVALDKREMSMDRKTELHSRLLGEFDAHIEQSLSIMKQKIDKVMNATKDKKRLVILQQQKDTLEQDMLEARLKTQQNVATRVTEKFQVSETIETENPQTEEEGQAAMAEWYGGDYQPKAQYQARSNEFLITNAKNAQVAETIEKSLTPEEFRKLQDAMRNVFAVEELGEISTAGDFIRATKEKTGQTPEDVMKKAIGPKGGRYWKAVNEMANSQARYVSGAAIKSGEYATELKKLIPTYTDTYDNRFVAANKRRRLLKAHKATSGNPNLLYFQKKKGSKKKGKK
jgi:hypothetical protein